MIQIDVLFEPDYDLLTELVVQPFNLHSCDARHASQPIQPTFIKRHLEQSIKPHRPELRIKIPVRKWNFLFLIAIKP